MHLYVYMWYVNKRRKLIWFVAGDYSLMLACDMQYMLALDGLLTDPTYEKVTKAHAILRVWANEKGWR